MINDFFFFTIVNKLEKEGNVFFKKILEIRN